MQENILDILTITFNNENKSMQQEKHRAHDAILHLVKKKMEIF